MDGAVGWRMGDPPAWALGPRARLPRPLTLCGVSSELPSPFACVTPVTTTPTKGLDDLVSTPEAHQMGQLTKFGGPDRKSVV